MSADPLSLLACPHCPGPDEPLTEVAAGVIGCAANHRFDRARQGYLPLLGPRSRTDTADSPAMISARDAFLSRGHYAPVADAVAAAVVGAATVLEVGAGTGYYLVRAVAGPRDAVGIALDASKPAVRRSARQLFSVLADAWARLPVRTAAVDGLISVFAPRDPTELTRVLAPRGTLVVATPEPDHLVEIRRPLRMLAVDAGKADALIVAFPELTLVTRATVRYPVTMDRRDLADLVLMGPAARHRSAEQVQHDVAELPAAVVITVAVTVSTFRRN